MPLLDFPSGPNPNDTTTQNGNTWKWNGTSWVAFNNLSLSSQVTGVLGTVYGGTGKALSSLTVGSILYADTASSFAALTPGANNYVLATQGNGQPPYWKVDDSGTGSVGSGTTGGFAYYTGLNSITSGSGFSYIAGSGNGGTLILTNGLVALIGSTITSGTWAGSAITLAYGGTNNNISGIGHSYRIAMYDAAGTAITNISSAGTASSVLFQSSQTVPPVWIGQAQLFVGAATTAGSATTAANIHGGALGNIHYQSAANTTAFVTNAAGSGASVLSQTGNNAPVFLGQSQLSVGISTNIGAGGAGSIPFNTAASTTTFLNHSGTASSVLVTTATGIGWTVQGSLFVGSASTAGWATTAGSATTAANIHGGSAGNIHYQSATNVTSFITNASGSGASVLSQTGNGVPVFLGQSQLSVGISTNIGAGGAGSIPFNTASSTTAFLNHSGAGNSILVTYGTSSIGWTSPANVSVGSATNATNATNTAITDDTSTATSQYITWVGSTSGNQPQKVTSNSLTFIPSTGVLSATRFSGSGVLLTGITTSLVANTGSGITLSGTGQVTISNSGVVSLTGTANQVLVAGSSGSATSGNITLTLPQDIASTSSPSFANITITNGTSSTLATVGSQPTSMVNKQYVDNLASGLDVHASVRVIQTSAIGASYLQTQVAGSAATGAFLISTTQVALPAIDGVTISATGVTQRVLIAGGATGKTSINGGAYVTPVNSGLVNGVYYVGALGGAGTSNWILVRATDSDDNVELTGGTFTFVQEGDLYKDTGWVCTNDTTNLGPIQFGLDNASTGVISFSQFTGAAAISIGQGLSRVGNTIATVANIATHGTYTVGVGFTAFTIGGALSGVAGTTFNATLRVGSTNANGSGTAAISLNTVGFSMTGGTQTVKGLTVIDNMTLSGAGNSLTLTGSISLPGPTQYGIAYGSSALAVAFTAAAAGSGASVLTQTLNNNPVYLGQSQLSVGISTNIGAGGAGSIPFNTASSTTTFLNHSGTASSVLVTTATGIGWTVQGSLFVGSASTAGWATTAGSATTSASIHGGSAGNIHYQSATNVTAFITNAAGSGASVLSQTGNGVPVYLGQSQLSVGISTNIGAGGAGSIPFNTSASTTTFLNHSGTASSVLVTTATGIGWTVQGSLFVGSASTAGWATTAGSATTAANIHGGSAGNIHYQSAANTTTFITNAAGSGASVLSQTGNGVPVFLGQSQLSVGISTNIGAGGAGSIPFNTAASTTAFLNHSGTASSVLVTTATGIGWTVQGSLFVGSASTSAQLNVSSTTGLGTSYLLFTAGQSGNQSVFTATGITVSAQSSAIYANKIIATGATVASSTSTGALIVAGGVGIGGSLWTATANYSQISGVGHSNGVINLGTWAGTAVSLPYGGTNNNISGAGHSNKVAVYNASGSAITSLALTQGNVILGATGGTYAGIASTLLAVAAMSDTPPAQPGGAIGGTQAGQLWWDSQYGVLKVYYNDGNTLQWVDATPVLGSSGGGSSTKRSYVMTFGAGFTPSTGADTVQIVVPYAPDNTSKFYYIKRLDYRNETLSSGAGVSFYIERFTGGNAAFNVSTGNRIHTTGAGAAASFVASSTTYSTSYTLAATGASFVSSSGVAASIISGDYLRLNFAAVNGAATVSVAMVIEEQ